MKHKIKLTIISTFFILASLGPQFALAQSDRYLGEIIRGGWNFCPRGTAPADGQLLAISSNDALFSLFGTIYGGDGRTNFALPDLRGRAAINDGSGPGLSTYRQGTKLGQETVTLTQTQMPAHTHTASLRAVEDGSNSSSPSGAALAESQIFNNDEAPSSEATLHPSTIAIGLTGNNQSHENRMPYLAVTYCVATVGLYPSRN